MRRMFFCLLLKERWIGQKLNVRVTEKCVKMVCIRDDEVYGQITRNNRVVVVIVVICP